MTFKISNTASLLSALLLIALLSSCTARKSNPAAYKDESFSEMFRSESGWIAGDGAYSVPLKDGSVLWAFGDSYIDCFDKLSSTVPCLFQARNALLRTDGVKPGQLTTLRNEENIPTFFNYGADKKYWFWPCSGFSSGDTAYIFLTRLRATPEGGMWGFEVTDSNYVAKISSDNKVTYSILPDSRGITFGVAVVADKMYTYVYGIRSNGFGNDLFVARFRLGMIHSKWQYYDGADWTNNPMMIKKIHSEFTSSFNVCRVKEKFVLLSTEFSVDCDQGRNIYAAIGDNPCGPFDDKHSVWHVNDTLKGHWPFFYCANPHPEFDNGRDELLVTYCINGYGKCVETCVDNRLDPDVYRPKAIRVPYSILLQQ